MSDGRETLQRGSNESLKIQISLLQIGVKQDVEKLNIVHPKEGSL